VTSEAPFGELYYWNSNEKIVLSQRLFGLKVKDSIISRYLYYYMQTYQFRAEMDGRATGSTVRGLRQPELLKCRIQLPSLNEQKAIANILSSLDDKIELNNKINKNLEEVARILYKRWFVDYEFPNEDEEPYKSSVGEMVESELGLIPEGWKIEELIKLTKVAIGKTPPRKEHQWFNEKKNQRNIRWYSIKDMKDVSIQIYDSSEYLTLDAIDKHNIKVIPKNTILMSFKLTIGRLAITSELSTTNEAIAHFVNDEKYVLNSFLYCYLKAFNFDSLGSTSSIATAINSKIVKKIPILLSPKNIQDKFDKVISSIFKKVNNLNKETLDLISLRDTLLPKLMNGEIEVPIEE
jgi:type I restriction enzyme S subunit